MIERSSPIYLGEKLLPVETKQIRASQRKPGSVDRPGSREVRGTRGD